MISPSSSVMVVDWSSPDGVSLKATEFCTTAHGGGAQIDFTLYHLNDVKPHREFKTTWKSCSPPLRHTNVCTIGSNGRSSNCTVIFRGFEENNDKIRITIC
ncbi:Pyridoxine/pyridoxamine 5'-phosphate oxidase 2 [Camellia lanceoleosa]|nr:Pyridoxine/pyridoxamine 5'-phosphate oxidase 2 [Camellia lanceoleosa]